MRYLALLVLLAGCDESIQAGGSGIDAGVDDDPLVFVDAPEPGSLDFIHRTIIQPGCASQPGLCHAGQFEPLMATPASFYAQVVNRPGLEHPEQLRVRPGSAADSLIIDKLRGRDVGTRMPLGAEPLGEAEIALIEAWIDAGAPRRPGEAAPAELNELPYPPQIALFDADGERLDGPAPARVAVGDALTFRLSTRDFETVDASIFLAALVLVAPDGRQILVHAGEDPQVAFTEFDSTGPESLGEQLNRRFAWTVPASVSLRDDATGVVTPDVPTAGMTLSVFAVYLDSPADDGIAALAIRPSFLEID